MRVVVTGGSGKVGRAAVRALKDAGHSVTNFDVRPPPDQSRYVSIDCTDFGAVLGGLTGIDPIGRTPDAVIHLAGIPAPGLAPDQRVFEVNTISTYNVFSACARVGVKRIVWASSETILGLPFNDPPAFAPLDETHPARPQWSYSLAKHLGETMAAQFTRWDPALSITSLRFSNVFEPHDYAEVPAMQARPDGRKWNLWSYIDARDAGEACRLAVENAVPGHEVLIIAAGDSLIDQPSAELMATYFPETPVSSVDGTASLQSSAKAARLIGFKPQHSWRDAVNT